MPQDNKSSHTDKQQPAEPLEAGQNEMDAGTKTSEARIWATANKLIRDANDPFEKEQ